MSELERLVVLIACLLEGGNLVGNSINHESEAIEAELLALLEVINTRAESTRNYHKTRRGVDALERAVARSDNRPVDYEAARAHANQGNL